MSPVINLTGVSAATLTFWHRFAFGSGDNGAVWIKPVGGEWIFLGSFTGTNLTWHQDAIGLNAYVRQAVQLAFQLFSDASGTADGWYIDDVAVTQGGETIPPDTAITGGPSGTIPTNVTFTWTGSDNLTPVGSLMYTFRLAPLETQFSTFGGATSQTYACLPTGSYTFYVKARDQAGNEDPTPANRSFEVPKALVLRPCLAPL